MLPSQLLSRCYYENQEIQTKLESGVRDFQINFAPNQLVSFSNEQTKTYRAVLLYMSGLNMMAPMLNNEQ